MKKKYCLIYDTPSFIGGIEYDDFEYAKDGALNLLISWEMDEMQEHKNDKESWDYMIDECSVWVGELNAETEEYEPIWYPTEEDLKSIGWVYMD